MFPPGVSRKGKEWRKEAGEYVLAGQIKKKGDLAVDGEFREK